MVTVPVVLKVSRMKEWRWTIGGIEVINFNSKRKVNENKPEITHLEIHSYDFITVVNRETTVEFNNSWIFIFKYPSTGKLNIFT